MSPNVLTGPTIVLNRDELRRLLWPTAWNGTVPQEERARREGNLSRFVREALDAIVQAPDGYGVEVARDAVERVLAGTLDDVEIKEVVLDSDEER